MALLNARLFHGGHKGTESAFGRCAERWGIPETTISFDGHQRERSMNVVTLSETELERGDVSMEIVFARLGRRFVTGQGMRRVIRSMFHIVSRGDHLFTVGWIQADGTVKGGTGWGVELAKFFNRPTSVFDQESERWFSWHEGRWQEDAPTIPDRPFSATGTRSLTPAGERAIEELFERSFGAH